MFFGIQLVLKENQFSLRFPSNVSKKGGFPHFDGFSRNGALCFSASFYSLGLENMEGIKEYGFDSLPIGELQEFQNKNVFITETAPLRKTHLKDLTTVGYLSFVEPNLPDGLISAQNYSEMKKLASRFTPNVTSFFGFESRLNSPDGRADFLFAVSSLGGEREALLRFLHNEHEAHQFLRHKEWQNIRDFVTTWANPASELYTNVLGLWLEFDTAYASQDSPIPCVFIHTIPLRITSSEEERTYDWAFDTALPLLLGHPLSSHLHQRLLEALRKLPEGASVMDIGVMLSRATTGARIVFRHLHPSQVIPYLESLGWSDINNELACIIKELQQKVTRVVLHITITEQGVDPKIGLECSFSPDRYHLETQWASFFDYLVRKGVCCPEKKTEVLNFLGVSQDHPSEPFNLSSYKIAVLVPSEASANALVRYISHVKLVYKPGRPLEAKVYPGVRLFGLQSTRRDLDVC